MPELKSLSPKQAFAEFWWCYPKYKRYQALIADGAIRTGKTMAMSLGFIQWAMNSFDNMQFIMAGKTILSLRRNVIENLVIRLNQLGYSVVDKTSANKLVITFGGRQNTFYLFGGKDKNSQNLVQGLTAAGCYFDEVALMPESFVNQATGRCITVPEHKYWFNCNPDSPNHWFKLHWIDDLESKEAIRVHFLMHDNPILSENQIKKASAMYSGAFYRRYILGEWATAEGLVYPEFSRDENIIDPDRIPYTSQMHIMAGVDWGYKHFGSIVVVGYDYVTDNYYVLEEITHKNRNIYYWVQKAHELQNKYGDIPFYCDTARTEHIEEFVRHDIDARYANKSVVPGIEIVGRLVKSRKLKIASNEYDATKVDLVGDEEQDNLVKEFFEYVWSEKSEQVVKEHDDVLDALRYVLYAYHLNDDSDDLMSFDI